MMISILSTGQPMSFQTSPSTSPQGRRFHTKQWISSGENTVSMLCRTNSPVERKLCISKSKFCFPLRGGLLLFNSRYALSSLLTTTIIIASKGLMIDFLQGAVFSFLIGCHFIVHRFSPFVRLRHFALIGFAADNFVFSLIHIEQDIQLVQSGKLCFQFFLLDKWFLDFFLCGFQLIFGVLKVIFRKR